MRPRLISVIVATYNWPQALDRVLAAMANQTWTQAEIVVADDGSKAPTTEIVAKWKAKMPFPMQHVWQEDDGFRLARIRNLAADAARGDYLIFMDGDCIAPPTFLEDHARLAEPGWFVGGRRAFVSERGTRLILDGDIDASAMTAGQFRSRARELFVKTSHAGRLRRLPLGPLRKLRPLTWRQVEGCNMAAWRDDVLKVCGFDEAFRQYGHEDVDFVIRLQRSGLKGKWANGAATLLHLDHGRGVVGDNSEAALAAIFAEDRRLPNASIFLERAA